MSGEFLSPEYEITEQVTEEAARSLAETWLREIDGSAEITFLRQGNLLHGRMAVDREE